MFMTDKKLRDALRRFYKKRQKKKKNNKHIMHPMSIHLALSVLEILGEF